MRRIAPFLCAVAAACVLAAPAGATPRATDFELPLGAAGPTAKAASAAPWTSRVIRTKRPFSVVGLRWTRAPEHLHASIRVRDTRGWHRWTELSHAHSVHGSDPAWAGRATAIQVRLSARVRGLKLHFVSVRGSAPRRAVARAAAAQPAIIPRSQWGGDTECKPRDAPTMGAVQMAFVHHTVSANEYGPADSAGMVLGICRFHRNSNGWDDVGYNFLVDKYGQIFEGRAGGVDQPVVGAQAQGWNSQSTGIANLGTYTDVPQTGEALNALANLIAWKLPLHGAPVTGTVDLVSAGGSSNRYPSGSTHTFERISGHQDGNETACPGAQLYAQLPMLRDMAAGRAPAVVGPAPAGVVGPGSKLSLTVMRRAFSFPEPARLTGRLVTSGGSGIGGQRVRIQVLTSRGFKAVASAVTGADGAYSAELPTSRNRVIRTLIGKIASRRLTLKVAPALEVPAPAKRVKAGRRSVLKGALRPKKGLVVVTGYRESRGRFRRAFSVRVRARDGRFRAAIRLARPGLYRLRLRFAGDKTNAPAQTDYFVRAVRKLSSVAPAVPAAR
jgi:hypothetical protein